MSIPLSKLKQKVGGKIASIESELVLTKLMELGIMPGAKFVIQNKAPFNGPLAILVNGTKIIIRRKEANLILVEAK